MRILGLPWYDWLIFVVVFLGAAAGIIYGLLRQYDRGFMKKNGNLLMWSKDKLPLLVSFTKDMPNELCLVFRSIAQEVNAFVGKTVFGGVLVPWETNTGSGVCILLDILGEEGPGGTAEVKWNEKTGQILSARVCIKNDLQTPDLETAMRHEIGHALGLDHDDKSDSVMHPETDHRSKKFTDRDVKLLRRAYAG